MLNRLKPRLLKGSKLSLMIAVVWTEELPLQIGSATAQPACELQPCDCRGPFDRPPIEITSEELMKAISAHQSWLSRIGSRLEYWKIDDQIEQYDPAFNLSDGGEGKYLCSKMRNGSSLFNNVDLGYSDSSSEVLASKDLRGACFRKSDLRKANFNNSELQGANFYKADLAGASLVGANLTGAIFDCANLRGADLTGATLTEANLYRALLVH